MNTSMAWQPWLPPYDPLLGGDSATVIQDEHGRMIETADCGVRCPGPGGSAARVTAMRSPLTTPA